MWPRASRAPRIVLDLDRVSFMDTRGSPQVRRLLEITGMGRYLSFVA
jgi:anti-anti-sigma regulatory factor